MNEFIEITERARWLANLVEGRQFEKGVEVGVKEGKTMDYLLARNPRLFMLGVDIWEPTSGYLDWDHYSHEKAAREALKKYGPRVLLLRAYSSEVSRMVGDGDFDFVFIDADHSEGAVTVDIGGWKSKVRSGGIICGHDVNKAGVRRAIDNFLPGWKEEDGLCWSFQL